MKHNVYFGGAVQSLGFEVGGRQGTVGIIEPGEYAFDAGAAERVEIISGTLDVLLPGADWTTVRDGGRYLVAAGAAFRVRAGTSVAYVCWFE